MVRALRTHPQPEKAPRASPRHVAGCFARPSAQVHTGPEAVCRHSNPCRAQRRAGCGSRPAAPACLRWVRRPAQPGSVRLGRAHLARPTLGRRLRIHSEMAKDLLDHRPLEDGGDDLELPSAAVRAVLHVDVEDALEQPRPADAMRPGLNRLCLAASRRSGFGGWLVLIRWPLRHHKRTQLRVRRQHPMKTAKPRRRRARRGRGRRGADLAQSPPTSAGLACAGQLKRSRAPPSGDCSMSARPPCDSTTRRTIASPSP